MFHRDRKQCPKAPKQRDGSTGLMWPGAHGRDKKRGRRQSDGPEGHKEEGRGPALSEWALRSRKPFLSRQKTQTRACPENIS